LFAHFLIEELSALGETHRVELAHSDNDPFLTAPLVQKLMAYAWPGNVRELERFIERAVALTESNQIELDDLTPHLRGDYVEILGPSFAAGESLRAWGSRYARLVFERCGRNKRRACRQLDISYHTLEAYLHYSRGDGYEGKQLPAGAPAATAPDAVHEAQE
jgi:DNA-binding NtrC family response regulator